MSKLKPETEAKLAEFIAEFYDDPYEFVMNVFPWGEPTLPDGSFNSLASKTGPEPWQRELLEAVAEHVRENDELDLMGLDPQVWRSAVASGHGVGKSAIVAWIIYWVMSTRRDTRGVVTASTQFQLEDKTWPELAKWHQLALNKHWFEWTATSFYFKPYPEDQRKNYMITAATVSEHKTEAFAGLHNEGQTVIVIFDEASGVLPKIWEVAEGALTDGEGFFFAFGNPTRPDGEFADCFDKHADMYHHWHVDSREVSHTNKNAINDILHKYGIDSNEAKVRVYGQFPTQSFNGFISVDIVNGAAERELTQDLGAGLIMSVDVARFGDDQTVIGYRQGRDHRSIPSKSFKGLNTMRIAEICMEEANRYKPDVIVIESTGPGAGVIDRLRAKGYRVHEVHPGAQSKEPDKYFNKRAELWSKMRDWLWEQGCIPDDPELFKQLTTILYTLDRHEQRTKMEPKADMKKRGLPSPDKADMLALTFAVTVPRRDMRVGGHGVASNSTANLHDDPLSEFERV